MDYKAIQELIQAVSQSDLYSVEIQSEGLQIKLNKGPCEQVIMQTAPYTNTMTTPQMGMSPQMGNPSGITVQAQDEVKEVIQTPVEEGFIVTSPIVGTFYGAGSPEAPPFIKVGDKVKKGQSLCIIEAMKLMNEIESEVDGEVVEILVQNEQMVEFGQKLFRIRV